MKKASTMIREYESQNPPLKKSARMYTYIRPLKNGECTIEIHAAVNSARKGEGLMTKRVFRMRTDRTWFDQRDVLWFSNWSSCAPADHWVVDFHESGRGDRYMSRAGRGDEFNVWHRNYVKRSEWGECGFPFATMLNGFDGTRYKYCGYTPCSGLSVAEYLALYDLSPKVELVSKAGLYKLLTKEAVLTIAENPDFAKWLARNHGTARTKNWTLRKCLWHYGREVNQELYKAIVAAEAERRRKAEREAERIRVAARLKESKVFSERINALYERLKDICKRHGAFDVYVPKNNEDMVREGEAMHNCIGFNYPRRVAEGQTVCVFLRKGGKPYIDIAIDARTFEITELRRVCNQDVDAYERKVAKSIAKRVGKLLKAA